MNAQISTAASLRRDRLLHEHIHDPYKKKSKLTEPTVCPVCQAVFQDGRWQWAESWPADSNQVICQACHRTKHGYPAGVVRLRGAFVVQHKIELLNLIRKLEQQENAEHPLNRIMKVEERLNSILISTTDIHLPRRIGEALHHAYKGMLDLHYDEEGCFIRVNWTCQLSGSRAQVALLRKTKLPAIARQRWQKKSSLCQIPKSFRG